MRFRYWVLLLLFGVLAAPLMAAEAEPVDLVRPMMGTSNNGNVAPVAASPFGMVELCPDTFFSGSGYIYHHSYIYGFSHPHKSGVGGTDFKDIMFFPLTHPEWADGQQAPQRVSSRFSHDKEHVEPGYYNVTLLDSDIDVELTATKRCGMHRYSYPAGVERELLVDLKHG